MTPKDFFIKLIWGNRFYHLLMRPLDRYRVEVKPAVEFSVEDIPLNKLCRLTDSRNPLWRKGFADLLFPPGENIFHRKVWEFCQTIYGLRKLKRLSPEAVVLGIGCGHEELMYFWRIGSKSSMPRTSTQALISAGKAPRTSSPTPTNTLHSATARTVSTS